jgi:Ca2+-transporting ATPase
MASEETAAASYCQPLEQVLQALGTDARNGLGEDEGRARIRQHGPNELAAEKRSPHGGRFSRSSRMSSSSSS